MMRVLAAAVLTVAIAVPSNACGNEDSDEQTLDALVAFARGPSDEAWSRLPLAAGVQLGLGEALIDRRSANALRDPASWEIDAERFRAAVGPFSALDAIARDDERPLEYGEGSYHRCASPPGPPPGEVSSLRRLNIQPREWESCLQWFAVDVFVTDDGEIAAVTLDYYEP
jgi:hypothetical protein